MSYPRGLDEIPDNELVGELKRRAEACRMGLCDYCDRPTSDPPCKFPDRHGRAQRARVATDELIAKWTRLYDQTD